MRLPSSTTGCAPVTPTISSTSWRRAASVASRGRGRSWHGPSHEGPCCPRRKSGETTTRQLERVGRRGPLATPDRDLAVLAQRYLAFCLESPLNPIAALAEA